MKYFYSLNVVELLWQSNPNCILRFLVRLTNDELHGRWTGNTGKKIVEKLRDTHRQLVTTFASQSEVDT